MPEDRTLEDPARDPYREASDGPTRRRRTLHPWLVAALAAGSLVVNGASMGWWSSPECVSLPTARQEARARRALPDPIPLHRGMRVASVERTGDTVAVEATWRSGLATTLGWFESYGISDLVQTEGDAEFGITREGLSTAEVHLERCHQRTDIRIQAVLTGS